MADLTALHITEETVSYKGYTIGLVEPINDLCGVTLFVEPEDLEEMPPDVQPAIPADLPEIEEYLQDRCGYVVQHEAWPGRRGI